MVLINRPAHNPHPRFAGLAQGVCDELEERASAWWADLDKLRRRAVDLACSDASATVEAAALEVIRAQVGWAACTLNWPAVC